MIGSEAVCPRCGSSAVKKDSYDRKGAHVYRCRDCRRRFTARSATPFSGYRFPPDVIARAVRWYVRYRLSYTDVAELLAERGIGVVPSTIFAWVQEFAPLYEAAARPFRHEVGGAWSVDETYVKVAGAWAYVYRAIDERGQIVDVYVSAGRAAEDAAAFFRRAIEATGVAPEDVTTDCAAAYPPALAAVLPTVAHETGKPVQQRLERDHQHLKGRVRAMRGFTTLTGAGVFCRAHAFVRNLRLGFYDLGDVVSAAASSPVPLAMRAWDTLTADLLGR
jgi:transposase, IS6 family